MYEPLLPFTPHAEFAVLQPLTIDGIDLTPGSKLPKQGLNERLLRQLYEQRRIGVIGPDYTGLFTPATPPARMAPETPAVAPPAPPVEPTSTPPRYRVKQAGLGGFKVIDAKGQPIGPGFKTKAEAEAEIARLTAPKE